MQTRQADVFTANRPDRTSSQSDGKSMADFCNALDVLMSKQRTPQQEALARAMYHGRTKA